MLYAMAGKCRNFFLNLTGPRFCVEKMNKKRNKKDFAYQASLVPIAGPKKQQKVHRHVSSNLSDLHVRVSQD
jgi:hypothetical protein